MRWNTCQQKIKYSQLPINWCRISRAHKMSVHNLFFLNRKNIVFANKSMKLSGTTKKQRDLLLKAINDKQYATLGA